ncbi:amidophosphoribosyltransferase [Frankia nepalensis]|uniref:Amidophosphoribosyltransferase n=1 Tax=Frankia nepalensis TaxID=1836974 RepID=A0A937RKQ9_9ACTN|nr:amidophosphoribosyltransferase [Frankia nepalensis]MBL7495394.1 amidophosphoribosyltransferase [Frankia nepalensis]MBL7508586.1 amidophosphoribosyltransferase [Frankia nepalensis]MBL7627716.1 amidophosphoribosyltransferase [Frankia nepalensis]
MTKGTAAAPGAEEKHPPARGANGRYRDIQTGDAATWEDDLRDAAGPQDACGVFGVRAPGEDVANLTYYGLYALQHRGQEAAGMAVADGRAIVVFKELGLVAQVFDERTLSSLSGHLAVGHTRYSTTGSSTWENAQPSYRTARLGGGVALAHNGNLTNILELADELGDHDVDRDAGMRATTDSDLITALLANHPGPTLTEAALDVLPRLRGAFSLVFSDASTLYAARDTHGIHPLVLGRLDGASAADGASPAAGPGGAWVVASETCALDIVGATFVREVEPGELVVIDADGPRSLRFAPADRHGCLFEFVYLARPDTTISGRSVHATRVEVGRVLAREAPVDADLVIPVPQSGVPAAVGYAEASGIPFGEGLVKNSYVGRTFIQPSQTIRQRGIRLKLNPLREVIEGRRLVVVDDSIVRGNTQRALVRMLREAGAAEVHIRISSPPVRWPCFYGIDFATKAELIASGAGVEQVRESLGADSLAYVSLDGLVAASRQPANELCRACFDGVYPVPLSDSARMGGKDTLETMGSGAATAAALAEALRRKFVAGMNGADPSPDDLDQLAGLEALETIEDLGGLDRIGEADLADPSSAATGSTVPAGGPGVTPAGCGRP